MTLPDTALTGAIPVWQRSLGSWRLSLEREPLDRSAIAHHYDRAATSWQTRIERLGMSAAYDRLARAALTGASALSHGALTALDCGIGTGAMSRALAQAVGMELAIDGVDLSPRMLGHARALLAPSGCLRTLRLGDVCDLPFPDAHADVTMAAHVVEHVADPTMALREIARVTRPGGLIVLCLTRRSPLGLFVQTRWRTHGFDVHVVGPRLRALGLIEIRRLQAGSRRFDAFSTAWAARKPE